MTSRYGSRWAFKALAVAPVALAAWKLWGVRTKPKAAVPQEGPPGASGQLGVHDVGGMQDEAPVDTADHPVLYWERCADAIVAVLENKGLMSDDELRRHIEHMEPAEYNAAPYYGRWAVSAAKTCLERGTLTQTELDQALGLRSTGAPDQQQEEKKILAPGTHVRIREEAYATRWRKPHLRTPGYVFGKVAIVDQFLGHFGNPEVGAFVVFDRQPGVGGGRSEHSESNRVKAPLYRVKLKQSHVWPQYGHQDHPASPQEDDLLVDIFEHWLEPITESDYALQSEQQAQQTTAVQTDDMKAEEHTHEHTHEHGHTHEARGVVEQTAVDREGLPSPYEALTTALVKALQLKGIVSKEELRKAVEKVDGMLDYSQQIGPRLVVRAWRDSEFRQLLLSDGNAAVKAFCGLTFDNKFIVVPNTPNVHNVLCCTLCSCYPRPVLGCPPAWYKSRSYRARVVQHPRAVLKEFGTEIPPDVRVVVYDSTADVRYMVLPLQPKGTEDWSEEQLLEIITRDTLIGVTPCQRV